MQLTKAANFSIETGARGGDLQRAFITVSGDMDYLSGAEVAAAIRRPLDNGSEVVVDLTGVTFMDSSGIAALFTAARDDAERERMAIVLPVQRQPARLAELTGMTGRFRIHEPAGA